MNIVAFAFLATGLTGCMGSVVTFSSAGPPPSEMQWQDLIPLDYPTFSGGTLRYDSAGRTFGEFQLTSNATSAGLVADFCVDGGCAGVPSAYGVFGRVFRPYTQGGQGWSAASDASRLDVQGAAGYGGLASAFSTAGDLIATFTAGLLAPGGTGGMSFGGASGWASGPAGLGHLAYGPANNGLGKELIAAGDYSASSTSGNKAYYAHLTDDAGKLSVSVSRWDFATSAWDAHVSNIWHRDDTGKMRLVYDGYSTHLLYWSGPTLGSFESESWDDTTFTSLVAHPTSRVEASISTLQPLDFEAAADTNGTVVTVFLANQATATNCTGSSSLQNCTVRLFASVRNLLGQWSGPSQLDGGKDTTTTSMFQDIGDGGRAYPSPTIVSLGDGRFLTVYTFVEQDGATLTSSVYSRIYRGGGWDPEATLESVVLADPGADVPEAYRMANDLHLVADGRGNAMLVMSYVVTDDPVSTNRAYGYKVYRFDGATETWDSGAVSDKVNPCTPVFNALCADPRPRAALFSGGEAMIVLPAPVSASATQSRLYSLEYHY